MNYAPRDSTSFCNIESSRRDLSRFRCALSLKSDRWQIVWLKLLLCIMHIRVLIGVYCEGLLSYNEGKNLKRKCSVSCCVYKSSLQDVFICTVLKMITTHCYVRSVAIWVHSICVDNQPNEKVSVNREVLHLVFGRLCIIFNVIKLKSWFVCLYALISETTSCIWQILLAFALIKLLKIAYLTPFVGCT